MMQFLALLIMAGGIACIVLAHSPAVAIIGALFVLDGLAGLLMLAILARPSRITFERADTATENGE